MAIRTAGLTKDFGGRGLFDLDLEVRPGEVYGYLGPNGAGKTTTIRLLMDLLRPTRGSCWILDEEPRATPALRRRIGYLPGDLALYRHLTGRSLLARLARMQGGVDPGRLDGLARRFRADLDHPIRALSGGNRQKVGILAAFQHAPDVYILDEPTAGLDPLMQQEFHRLVREEARAGRTVLLSSHVLAEVEAVCDRVGILREGRLVEEADLEAPGPRRLVVTVAPGADVSGYWRLPGVTRVEQMAERVRVSVDGPLGPVLAGLGDVTSVRTEGLSERFLDLYREVRP